ncbi:5-formyltetrahydrofolate cyclo-ligase [Sphingomonas bacterium]|uniref:5-formyltetrahydrofolate cyclo-ligase n=1 Tax=Sphingomonas bacterium TaxID=1895847 RepID=UPI0015769247|nr:5-formyltetrahydrofolate cyclo-ligase [Sphingomonas bacterium]
MTDKPTLRRQMRSTRDSFAPPSPVLVDPAYRARLAAGVVVAAYHPIGSEADPAPLVAAAVEAGCRITLPHVVDRATPVRFLAVDDRGTLEAGPFGLYQPATAAPELEPAIILTPLLAFDRRGNRLGQGAGHYDRAFAAHPAAWRVGIAWSVQEVAALDADPWDVPLHAVATEREWIAVA